MQLPDEYDEIFEDIEPFWGIDPAELALTQEEYERREGLVTVQKTETHPRLEVTRSTLSQDRQKLQGTVDNILNIVREVEQDLPPLRITFSPFDNPSMLSDWGIKTMALEAAANGTSLFIRLLRFKRYCDVQWSILQYSHAQTCLQSKNKAGSRHVPPIRPLASIHPCSHPHPPIHPFHSRLPGPLLLLIGTR